MLVYIVIGVACIIWGGDITVDSAKQIAAMLGMSDTLIGLTSYLLELHCLS